MLLLPSEILLKIIYSLRASSKDDLQTLRSLPLICKRFAQLIYGYRRDIVEYYTVVSAEDKRTRYLFCGQLHRDGDLPAIIQAGGTQAWYVNGKLHRDNDLPAIVCSIDGTQRWYAGGDPHRGNGLPAIVFSNGTQKWYRHGKRHRDNDLPAVIWADGSQFWYADGMLHRDNNQPAIIGSDGRREWWTNGERIR